MLGYWDDLEKTAEAIDADGWMHTGDLAVMREDGYCNIVGRIKDMVIRGGENIYPREIEEFLYTHPDVEDVQVVGVPDERYGEELCAWVRMRDGPGRSTPTGCAPSPGSSRTTRSRATCLVVDQGRHRCASRCAAPTLGGWEHDGSGGPPRLLAVLVTLVASACA